MLSLPIQLEAAINAALKNIPTSQWMSEARMLSERYRAERKGTEHSLASGEHAALGYAAIILPAAYAQLSGAMHATKIRIPAWEPRSMLDIGSGPGTALWAAVAHWPSLKTLTAWEREQAFINLGRQFAKNDNSHILSNTQWQRVVIGSTSLSPGVPMYDLVVIGHVLNELSEQVRNEIVTFAWEHCKGVLLIVEPGTSAAFLIVKSMREYLLTVGAKTVAPCAHDKTCPLVGDWCHFPQRLDRPDFQRRAKSATAGWEESKFSYAAMSRNVVPEAMWGRLIHQPHKRKGVVELTVSSSDGIVKPIVTRKDHRVYRAVSSYEWGDALENPLEGKNQQHGVEGARLSSSAK